MHPLLPTHRGRPADGLLRDLRRQDPLPRRQSYDCHRVKAAASVPDEKDLLAAQLDLFLDPNDPDVQAAARADGITDDWLEAATRSPVYALAVQHRVALPLHPEYRTLPMVWYVPPLSPVMSLVEGNGSDADPDDVFPAIDELRIPVDYLANLLTAGDPEPVRLALKRLAAMRGFVRERNLGGEPGEAIEPQSAWSPPKSTTCSGCSRSPSTTSAT